MNFTGLVGAEPAAKERLVKKSPIMPLLFDWLRAVIVPPPEIGKFCLEVVLPGLTPAFTPSRSKPVLVRSILTIAASAEGVATKPAPMPVARYAARRLEFCLIERLLARVVFIGAFDTNAALKRIEKNKKMRRTGQNRRRTGQRGGNPAELTTEDTENTEERFGQNRSAAEKDCPGSPKGEHSESIYRIYRILGIGEKAFDLA